MSSSTLVNQINDELAEELCALIEEDDRLRETLAQDGSLFVQGYHPDMAALHTRNLTRLVERVSVHGWPGRSLVGPEAANAAWRILQHGISQPVLVRKLAPLVADAAARGEVEPRLAAMLEDRIRVLEGRLQRYGTQYDYDQTLTAMVPQHGVEEPETLNERRAALGLPEMQWRLPIPTEQLPYVPKSWDQRQEEMTAWAQRCGWRGPDR